MKTVHHKNGDPTDNRPENLEVRDHPTLQQQQMTDFQRIQAINADLLACLKIYAYTGDYEGRPSPEDLQTHARAIIKLADGG